MPGFRSAGHILQDIRLAVLPLVLVFLLKNILYISLCYMSRYYIQGSLLYLTLFFPQTLSCPPLPPFFLSPTFAHSNLPCPYFIISSPLPLPQPSLIHPASPSSFLSFSALSILCSLLLSPFPLPPFSSQITSPSQLSSETDCR